jgi:hypothetical protein
MVSSHYLKFCERIFFCGKSEGEVDHTVYSPFHVPVEVRVSGFQIVRDVQGFFMRSDSIKNQGQLESSDFPVVFVGELREGAFH